MDFSRVKAITIPEGNVKKLEINGVKVWEKPTEEPDYFYMEALADGTVSFQIQGTLTNIPTLEYSIDSKKDSDFAPYTFGNTISLRTGSKIYFRGNNNTFSESESNYIDTINSINVNLGGNIMSLLDKTCELKDLTGKNYVFYSLFEKFGSIDSKVVNIDNLKLPAITLSSYCYNAMFYHTYIESIPEEFLPATLLADYCYLAMFSGCSSLTTIPSDLLPATTLTTKCYCSMFTSCILLKLSATQEGNYTKPFRIPAEGIGIVGTDSLYSMFNSTGGTLAGDPQINTTYYLWEE